MKAFLAALATALLAAPPSEAWEISSGPARVGLLELYTSEGCSSCPPADAWLGEFRAAPGLWKNFVPVAFHVDYWDGLGWPDKFASAANTRRQRDYAAAWSTTTIATPGVVWNGGEVRDWRGFRPGTRSKPGRLTATDSRGAVAVRFAPTDEFNGGTAHVAWLQSGIKSSVRAGENRGRTITHHFVAIATAEGAVAKSADGIWRATIPTAAPRGATEVAIWISGANSPSPIQAAGGPI